MKRISIFLICYVWAQAVSAQSKLTEAQLREMYDAMIPEIDHGTLAYQAAVMQKMLEEANYFADRLKLPTPHPIQITDIEYPWIGPPWYSIIHNTNALHYPISVFGTNIYDSNIPREARLRALKIGASGTIETTNFKFYFYDGKVREIMRLSEHEHDVERYAHDLDKLVGKPSQINEAQAHELAT